MDKGYVRLYRKTLESPIFMDEKLLKVWVWCLLKATHQPYEICLTSGIKLRLEQGQFICGRKKAGEELKMTESTFYRRIQALKALKMLSTKPYNKWTVVTVENWSLYQHDEFESEQKSVQRVNTYKNNNNNIYISDTEKTRKSTSNPKPIRKQIPPTLAMVTEYCQSRQNQINPQNFIDYYEARDWFAGKSKMKDWQAAIRTWENNSNQQSLPAKEQVQAEVKKYDI